MLKQDRNSPIEVELQIAIIYAVVNNMLRDIPTSEIRRFEEELFEYLVANRDELLKAIKEKGELSPDMQEELAEAIRTVINKFLNKED